MTKTLKTLIGAALVLGLTATGASASDLAVGDSIRFNLDPPATETGRFGIYRNGSTPADTLLWTFCVELNEYITGSDPFYIYGIDKSADLGGLGGGSPDPLDARTAALFLASKGNDLSGVSGWGAATVAQRRDSLQLAIWAIEDECGGTACNNLAGLGIGNALTALAANLINWASSLSSAALAAALADVDVLNLSWGTGPGGDKAQSVLYTTVPEPGSLLLLGSGLVGVARAVRRRRQIASA